MADDKAQRSLILKVLAESSVPMSEQEIADATSLPLLKVKRSLFSLRNEKAPMVALDGSKNIFIGKKEALEDRSKGSLSSSAPAIAGADPMISSILGSKSSFSLDDDADMIPAEIPKEKIVDNHVSKKASDKDTEPKEAASPIELSALNLILSKKAGVAASQLTSSLSLSQDKVDEIMLGLIDKDVVEARFVESFNESVYRATNKTESYVAQMQPAIEKGNHETEKSDRVANQGQEVTKQLSNSDYLQEIMKALKESNSSGMSAIEIISSISELLEQLGVSKIAVVRKLHEMSSSSKIFSNNVSNRGLVYFLKKEDMLASKNKDKADAFKSSDTAREKIKSQTKVAKEKPKESVPEVTERVSKAKTGSDSVSIHSKEANEGAPAMAVVEEGLSDIERGFDSKQIERIAEQLERLSSESRVMPQGAIEDAMQGILKYVKHIEEENKKWRNIAKSIIGGIQDVVK